MNYRRAILFDCGGTLIHMEPSREQIVFDFLKEKEINIDVENVRLAYRIVDFSFKQRIENQKTEKTKENFLINYNTQLFKVLGLSLIGKQWAKKLLQKFKKKKKWVLFPDTISSLNILKQADFLLGVAANWDKSIVSLLDQFNISQFFSVIISSVEVMEEKPNPRIIQHAIQKMCLPLTEAFYVGNEYEIDVVAARKAGVVAVLIDRDNYLPYADCLRFATLLEMANYLTRNYRKRN